MIEIKKTLEVKLNPELETFAEFFGLSDVEAMNICEQAIQIAKKYVKCDETELVWFKKILEEFDNEKLLLAYGFAVGSFLKKQSEQNNEQLI